MPGSGRPRRAEVRRFREAQGYHETRTDHHYYDKAWPDGSTSGTKVSFGNDSRQIPARLWTRVWRRQLRLAVEAEFWRGLEGQAVAYDIPPTPEPETPLRGYLSHFLRTVPRHSEEQIAATTREEAQRLLNAHHASELRGPPG